MLCHDGHRFECIANNELQMHLILFVCLLFNTQRSLADIGGGRGGEMEAHGGAVRRG